MVEDGRFDAGEITLNRHFAHRKCDGKYDGARGARRYCRIRARVVFRLLILEGVRRGAVESLKRRIAYKIVNATCIGKLGGAVAMFSGNQNQNVGGEYIKHQVKSSSTPTAATIPVINIWKSIWQRTRGKNQ